MFSKLTILAPMTGCPEWGVEGHVWRLGHLPLGRDAVKVALPYRRVHAPLQGRLNVLERQDVLCLLQSGSHRK